MSQLETGYTFNSRTDTNVYSQNDLIFFRNIELELVEKRMPNHDLLDVKQTDHAIMVFKLKCVQPKLAKPFFNWKKIDKNSEIKNKWNNSIYKGRWYIIFITLIWVIFSGYQAATLGPLTKPEEMVSIDHPSVSSKKILEENFVS